MKAVPACCFSLMIAMLYRLNLWTFAVVTHHYPFQEGDASLSMGHVTGAVGPDPHLMVRVFRRSCDLRQAEPRVDGLS